MILGTWPCSFVFTSIVNSLDQHTVMRALHVMYIFSLFFSIPVRLPFSTALRSPKDYERIFGSIDGHTARHAPSPSVVYMDYSAVLSTSKYTGYW